MGTACLLLAAAAALQPVAELTLVYQQSERKWLIERLGRLFP